MSSAAGSHASHSGTQGALLLQELLSKPEGVVVLDVTLQTSKCLCVHLFCFSSGVVGQGRCFPRFIAVALQTLKGSFLFTPFVYGLFAKLPSPPPPSPRTKTLRYDVFAFGPCTPIAKSNQPKDSILHTYCSKKQHREP